MSRFAFALVEAILLVGNHTISEYLHFTSTYTDYSVNNNALWSASQDMANSSLWGTVIAYASA